MHVYVRVCVSVGVCVCLWCVGVCVCDLRLHVTANTARALGVNHVFEFVERFHFLVLLFWEGVGCFIGTQGQP